MQRQGYKEVQPTGQKPTWKQSAKTHTDKSTKKSHWQVKSIPRGKSTLSTQILLKPPIRSNHEVDQLVTKADCKRRWRSQAASLCQCQLPMTVGCKICHTEHTEALHRSQTARGCLNLTMHLMFMIDGYSRYQQWFPQSMPSHEWELYQPDEFQQWPTPRYKNDECSTERQVRCCTSSEVETRWNQSLRIQSRGNGSIVPELRTEAKLSIGHSLLLFLLFSSLLHTLLLHQILACINGVSTGFATSGSQSMGGAISPCAVSVQRSPWAVLIGSATFECVRVRTQQDCLMLSFPFLSFSFVRLMQPRRSSPKEEDNVIAIHDPGWAMAILPRRLTTSLRSLAIVKPIHVCQLSLASTSVTIFLLLPYI